MFRPIFFSDASDRDAFIQSLDYYAWLIDHINWLNDYVRRLKPTLLPPNESVGEDVRLILVAEEFEERVRRIVTSVTNATRNEPRKSLRALRRCHTFRRGTMTSLPGTMFRNPILFATCDLMNALAASAEGLAVLYFSRKEERDSYAYNNIAQVAELVMDLAVSLGRIFPILSKISCLSNRTRPEQMASFQLSVGTV